MNIARGYQAQVTTSTGDSFVIGASWSGGTGGKNGELYDPGSNTWSLLSGAPVAPMLTADAQGAHPRFSGNRKGCTDLEQASTALITTACCSVGRTDTSSKQVHPKQ